MSSEAAEAKTEAAPAAAAVHRGGGGSKLALILTAVNFVATLAMVAILFISFQRDKKKPSVEDIAANAAPRRTKPRVRRAKRAKKRAKKAKEGGKKKTADYGKMVTLEQFTVNLVDAGQREPEICAGKYFSRSPDRRHREAKSLPRCRRLETRSSICSTASGRRIWPRLKDAII